MRITISTGLLAFLMFSSFILGITLVCSVLIPSGADVEDLHFPDFWNASCK